MLLIVQLLEKKKGYHIVTKPHRKGIVFLYLIVKRRAQRNPTS